MMKSWIQGWKPGDGIRMGIVTVTPEMARDYLAHESYTRGERKGLVARYAKAMKEGRWALNGEPIVFDHLGQGVEGHHRCLACASVGVPFKTVVVMGVEHDAVGTINRGAPRTQAQAIGALHGRKADMSRTPLITRIMQVEGLDERSGNFDASRQVALFDTDTIERLDRELSAGLDFVCEKFRTHKVGLSHLSMRAAIVKAFYHVGRKYPGCGGRRRLEEFCDVVITGKGVDDEANSAAHVLREHLREGRHNNGKRSHDQGPRVFRLTLSAIDKFMLREKVSKVSYVTRDIFPLLDGSFDAGLENLLGTSDEYREILASVDEAIATIPMATPAE